MANQLTPIASNIIASSGTLYSLTFSTIPNTYTDIILKWSARGDTAGSSKDHTITVNGDNGTNYSYTLLNGDGSTAASTRGTSIANVLASGSATGAPDTANTFAVSEILIPNYLSTANRPISIFSATENNATGALLRSEAALYRGASAITSITIGLVSGFWVAGSRFDLYGILHA
jgi:hypothetical protein